jgi:U3 small nucleolar RNA-associated protein 4
VHALAFDPARCNVLVLGFADNSLLVYDVESRAFPEWALALQRSLPRRFTGVHDTILGVTFDPSAASRRWALFWGATWMCKVPLHEARGATAEKTGGGGRKRKTMRSRDEREGVVQVSTEEPSQDGFRMITHYRPLLGVEFLSDGELVVVERPLVDALAKLPPAYFRHKYGAT